MIRIFVKYWRGTSKILSIEQSGRGTPRQMAADQTRMEEQSLCSTKSCLNHRNTQERRNLSAVRKKFPRYFSVDLHIKYHWFCNWVTYTMLKSQKYSTFRTNTVVSLFLLHPCCLLPPLEPSSVPVFLSPQSSPKLTSALRKEARYYQIP